MRRKSDIKGQLYLYGSTHNPAPTEDDQMMRPSSTAKPKNLTRAARIMLSRLKERKGVPIEETDETRKALHALWLSDLVTRRVIDGTRYYRPKD